MVPATPHNQTILVVDDVPMVLGIAKSSLATAGYNVLTAASGEECIRIHQARGDSIAVTILDFQMPGLDGLQTYAELKKLKPQVRVILSSGTIPEEEEEEMCKMGVAGVVSKPYSAGILLRAVKWVLMP